LSQRAARPLRVAVYCGSSRRVGEPYVSAARALGDALARRGHVMVYGGGRTGLMGHVADAALAAGGRVHGVILDAFVRADVHHGGLHELHQVDNMRARKQGLDERADAFVALPGGLGTLEELAEILSFRKLGFHARPLVLLDTAGFWAPLVAQLELAIAEGFDRDEVRGYFAVTRDPDQAVRLCEAEPGPASTQDW
jgi:uncharacterized protein (TIGR00730 family)